MIKRVLAVLTLALAFGALSGVASAPDASAATQKCTTRTVTKVVGKKTTKTEKRDCTRDNGGYSHSVMVKVSLKEKKGTSYTSTRTTDSRSISKTGKITDTHTVTKCAKKATTEAVCTTETTTTTGE